jgi:murein DD-endopeptidase MepM/ murein hydrolase activator NlpD
MTIVTDSLKKSTININNISKSLSETKRSVSTVNDSVSNISKIISSNTRIKKELFANSEIISSRRREASKRQELEDQIESAKVSTKPSLGLAFAGRSDKGPFGRLLGFLGFTFAGWIAENLPTWIFMGKEFISRIQMFGKSMYNMVGNMELILQSFGSVLKNSFSAIINLDLNEFSDGSVAKSFNELNLAVQGLGDDLTETFKLFTTPLNKSLETGEEAPALDEDRPDTMFPTEGGYATAGLSGVARQRVGTDTAFLGEIKRVSQKYNIREGDLLGLIASESGFDPASDNGTHVGLIQFGANEARSVGTTQSALIKMSRAEQMKYVDKYFETRKLKKGAGAGQLYATVFAPAYASGDPNKVLYSSPSREYASNAPLDTNQDGKITIAEMGGRIQKKKKEFGISDNVVITSTAAQSPMVQVPVGNINPKVGDRLGAGRNHGGVDLQVPSGTPLRAISDGVIVDSDYEKGWGNFLVMKDNLGIYHLYGHMQSGYKRGGPVKKGEVIGKVGMTGRTTGPHLHWEAGTGWNGGTITGRFDALKKYSKYAPFNTQVSKETPAQISTPPSRVTQPAAMTPERKGPQLLIIEDIQPQIPQVSYSSPQQSQTPTISESKLLNNFIKNKLLLDLAYL